MGVFAVSLCSALQSPDREGSPSISTLDGREWLISPPAEDQSQTWPHHTLTRRRHPYIALLGETITGSSGCGTLAGKLHGAGDRISMEVRWTDDPAMACDAADRNDASQIVGSLNRVARIVAPPKYWQDDAFLLSSGKGETLVVLSPMKTGNDLSDLQDSFWRLSKLDGMDTKSPDIVIWIDQGQVTLSMPSILHSYPFRYELAGLKFFPAWRNGVDRSKTDFAEGQKVAVAFEASLHRVANYHLEGEHLIFSDKDQRRLMVLDRLRALGLETQHWRIVKYRSAEESAADRDGLTIAAEFADVTFLQGRVFGTPGCGGWVGSYSLQGDTLAFNADFMLAGLCRPAETAQGEWVVKAFKGKLRIEDRGNGILLRRSDGRAAVVLVKY